MLFYLLIHKNKNIITFLILISISIFNLISYKTKYDTSNYNIISFLFLPILSSIHTQINTFQDHVKRIYDITTYKEKLKNLEASLIEKQVTSEEKDLLIEENFKLKKELLYQDFLNSKYSFRSISAKVIYRMINYPYPILILNRGLVNNVKTGMPVLKFNFIKREGKKSLENIAIGRIGKVNQYFSELVPISSTQSKIYSKIVRTPYSGFVEGVSYKNNLLVLNYRDKFFPLSKEQKKI